MTVLLPSNTDYTDQPLLPSPFESRGIWPEYVPCKACKQHGYYVLQLNAYGPGKHFRGVCQNCNGWGWVDPKTDCTSDEGHKFRPIGSVGRCLTLYRCRHCQVEVTIDSSD